MSAPQIPNLNSFRRGGLRGRGRGGNTTVDNSRKSKDEVVQDTDNDAASSRLSAVDAGYLNDPFAKLLTNTSAQKRLPLMNRGTYARTTGIDKIVDVFLASEPGRKQIISLGAGSDTRYFRLKKDYADLDLVYHEIDFEVNTTTKINHLKNVDFMGAAHELCSIDVNDYQMTGSTLTSSFYYIHAQDLRTLPDVLPGIDTQLTTLVLSECCLIYLSPHDAENVLSYFAQRFTTAPLAVAIYEPVRPNDSFGRTMVRNLISRGIHLQTLEKYAELDQQRQRLRDHQLEPRAEDIDFIWKNWVSNSEKERVENLEWMDEVEEFVLLAKHYCIAWGWKGWNDDSRWNELPTSRRNAKQ